MNDHNKEVVHDEDVAEPVLDLRDSITNDLKAFKAGIKLTRSAIKWGKPILKHELKLLPKAISQDELDALKNLANQSRISGKKGRAITSVIKNNALKASTKKTLQVSIDKFQERMLVDKVSKSIGIVDNLLKSYNSALTACINLTDPDGIRGMPALVFEMLARSGEIYFVDGLSNLVVASLGATQLPVVVSILAPVAISILLIKPSWDLIESTARSLVKQLQSQIDDKHILPNLQVLSHAEIINMLPNPIALIYDRNMEDLAQKWLPVIQPTLAVGLHLGETDSVSQQAVNKHTLPEVTVPQSKKNQNSTPKPAFKRHTTVNAGIKTDIFGQPGLGFESQTQMSEQYHLKVAANLAGLTPQTRAISVSGDVMYLGDKCSIHGGVSVYKTTTGAGAAAVGSILTADGAVSVGFSSTYGWFISFSAMTPWGVVALSAAIVGIGAGLLTKKLLDKRAENFFPFLDNQLKPNKKIAKFVALSCEKSLTKKAQEKLQQAFQQSKMSADAAGREFLSILQYFQTHRSIEAIAALKNHDYQQLIALYDHAFRAGTAPIYKDIEAGRFQDAYQKCVQSQQNFLENDSLLVLKNSILDIIKFQEMVEPIYAEIEASHYQEAYQKCIQAQQIFPDNPSLMVLKKNVSTQIAYYEALHILDKQGCDAAMQHFVGHTDMQENLVRHQFALSVAFVNHGNLSDSTIDYCKESIQRFLEIPDISDVEKGTAHFCQAYFLSLKKDYASRQTMLTELETAHKWNKASASIASLLAKEYARRFQYEQARTTLQHAGEPTTIVDLAMIEHHQLSLMIFSNMIDYVMPFLKFMQPNHVRGLLKAEQIIALTSSGAFLLWRYQAELHINAQQQRELAYFFGHCSAEEKAIYEALLPYDQNLQQLRKLQLSISVLIFVHHIVAHLAPKDKSWDTSLRYSGAGLDVANTAALSALSWVNMQRAFEKRSQALGVYRAAIEQSDTAVALSSSMDSMLSLLDAAASAFFVLVPVCSCIDRNYYGPRRNAGHASMSAPEIMLQDLIWLTAEVGGLGLGVSLLYHYRAGIDDMLRYVVNNTSTNPEAIHAGIDLARQQLEAWSQEGIELTKDVLQKIVENLDKIPTPTPEQLAIGLGAAIVVAGGTYVYLRQKWYNNGINNTKIQLQKMRQDPQNAALYINEAEKYNTIVLTHYADDATALSQKTEIAVNKLLLQSGFAEENKSDDKNNKKDIPYEVYLERRQHVNHALALCDQAMLAEQCSPALTVLRFETLLHAVKIAAAIHNARKTHHNQQIVINLLKSARENVEAISEKSYWSRFGLYWLNGEGEEYWKKTLELEMLESHFVAVLNAIKKLETYHTSSMDWLDQLHDWRTQVHQAMQLFSKNIAVENQKALTAVSSQFLTRHFEPRLEPFNGPFTSQQRIWRGNKAYCVEPDGTCTEWVEQPDQEKKVDDIIVKNARLYKIKSLQNNQKDLEEFKDGEQKILPGQVVWVKNNLVYYLERWVGLKDREQRVGDLVEEIEYQKITCFTEEDGKLTLINNAYEDQIQVSLKIQEACYELAVRAWFDGVMAQFSDDIVLFPYEKQTWFSALEIKTQAWLTDTQSTLAIVESNQKDINNALESYKTFLSDFFAKTSQEIDRFLAQLVKEHKLYETKKAAPAANCSVEELKDILTKQVDEEKTLVNKQLDVCADTRQTLRKEIDEADKRVKALSPILTQEQQRLEKKLALLVRSSMQTLVFKTSIELSTSVTQIIISAISSSYTRFLARQQAQQPLPDWTYQLSNGSQQKSVPNSHLFWQKPKNKNNALFQTNAIKSSTPRVTDTLFTTPAKKKEVPFTTKKHPSRPLF